MAGKDFSDLGRIEAIKALYEGTPYEAFGQDRFETAGRGYVAYASKVMLEGIDFDLVYFPLKHLGYKSVLGATGELYVQMAHPVAMSVRLGVSAKLDFAQVRELWDGVVAAAREHGYKQVDLIWFRRVTGCVSAFLLSARHRS